jgi:phosphotriesterase-related protein
VGRRPDIVEYVANMAELPTMMVTGIYHEPYQPPWVASATVEEIIDFLLEELNVGVGDTGVQAGWIKLAQSWGGPTDTELKVLEAACDAAQLTGASIGSHILEGATALRVIDALEEFGCDAGRFIWIHAPYYTYYSGSSDDLFAAAEAGAYLSFDFIGSQFWAGWLGGSNPNAMHIALIEEFIDAGYEDQILIGSDTGWFDPGNPDFLIEPYDQIMTSVIPDMIDAGFSDELIQKFLHDNPWNAYSR